MEEVHSDAEPNGYSDSPITISQPPDIKNWFSSYVYESLALTSSVKESESELKALSVQEEEEEEEYIHGADKDHKPMSKKNIQETDLYESSLLSEPPDIANWFSSYAYESQPILDTNDALYFSVGGEDSEFVKETQAQEEEEEEANELEGKDVCPSLFQQELVPSANVTDLSQSQHLLSEPPDVGNWFSSYAYDSPQLSDTHELEFCSAEKDQLIVEESDSEGETSSGLFRKTKSKQETIAPGWLKSSNDCIASDTTEVSSEDAYSNQEREKKSPVSLFNASTREVGKEESRSFKQEPLLDEARFSRHSGVSCYNPKLQSLLACLQEEKELRPKQDNHETIPTTTTSSSMQKKSPRKSAQKEENLLEENVDTETGFVTMKKARFRDQSYTTRPNRGVLGECSRSKELKKILREAEDEEEQRKKRRVLGEEEIAGKWSCPQRKKKGKSGPPLKQLRLDAWVHKV